jgi:hypothetical protein
MLANFSGTELALSQKKNIQIPTTYFGRWESNQTSHGDVQGIPNTMQVGVRRAPHWHPTLHICVPCRVLV